MLLPRASDAHAPTRTCVPFQYIPLISYDDDERYSLDNIEKINKKNKYYDETRRRNNSHNTTNSRLQLSGQSILSSFRLIISTLHRFLQHSNGIVQRLPELHVALFQSTIQFVVLVGIQVHEGSGHAQIDRGSKQ
jgi:hypothetical protein